MQISKEIRGTVLVVKPAGELDHHTAATLKEQIESELAQGVVRDVVLDLSGLAFMDSSGLGVLLGRYKHLARWQGKMMACGLQPPVEKVFRLSGLERLIPVHQNLAACLRALEG